MAKRVSARTGKTTYFNVPSSPVPTPSGPVPALPTDWSVTSPAPVVQERRMFTPDVQPPGGTSVSVAPGPVDVRAKSSQAIESLRDTSTGIRVSEPVPKVREFRPVTLQEARTIPQAVGVVGRSLGAAIQEVFPITRGLAYTREELRSLKPGETVAQFQSRIKSERVIGSGVSLAFAAIPIGKAGQLGARALPRVAGTGATTRLFSSLFGGLRGIGGIYSRPGIVTRGIQPIAAGAARIGARAERIPVLGRGARFLGEHPLLRAGLGFGQALIAPEAYAAGAKAITSKPETKRTLTSEQESLISKEAFRQAEIGFEYEKVSKGKRTITAEEAYAEQRKAELSKQGLPDIEIQRTIQEEIAPETFTAKQGFEYPGGQTTITVPKEFAFKDTGKTTKEITDYDYVPKYPGIESPFGRISAGALIPAAQVMPLEGVGEQYGIDFKESVVKQLTKQGWNKSEATKYAEYLDVTERQARGYGGVHGMLAIGISEETLAQNLFRKAAIESGKITVKGLTKKQAAQLVSKSIGTPLLAAGVAGGTTSVVVEQRMKQQELEPVSIGFGGLLGAGTAFFLGKAIATRAITSPTASKGLYAVGSIFDPFELPSDILESKIAKRLGQKELRLPIRTTTVSVTPSVTPAGVTPVPTAIVTPSVAPGIISTPVPVPGVAPVSTVSPVVTPVPVPTPVPIVTPTPEPTPTQTIIPTETAIEAFTATPTETLTATSTLASTFIPTFTGQFMPFIPPIAGGGEFARKKTRRERTRFIDEFTAAFAGLARPLEPTIIGKKRPIDVTRKMYKPKKRKSRKKSRRGGGVNFERLDALFF